MNPVELSEKLVLMAHEYSERSDELADILVLKPAKWLHMRSQEKSATDTDRLWDATEDGMKETRIKLKMKSLEKLMSAIRTRLRIQEVEARNIV